MKALAVTLLFLLLASAFFPCALVNAEISAVPHEDPSSAQSMIDSLSFLIQYAEIFSLMASKQYDNASQLSEQLSHITVPDDLSYIINRFNDLTQQLITQLNDLEQTLNRASSLLDQYRLDEAREELDHAGVVVAKAQILLNDLKDATSTISQRLGVLAAPAESKVRQAYAELQRMIQRLKDLIDQYQKLLERANQRIEEIKSQNLEGTAITLSLNATRCFVGGYVSAAGVLTSSGGGLGNRAVTLLIDGVEAATVKTTTNGTYQAAVRIPYKYVPSVSVKAVFSPSGNDVGVYLGSTSPSVKVEVLYYTTLLDASTPAVGYPGLALVIGGKVTSQEETPLSERQVKVLLDGVLISQQTTDENGTFRAQSTISANAKLGKHTLALTVDPKGVYAGVSIQRNLTIQKMATTIEVTAPSFTTLPSKIEINGTVKSASTPLSGANIQVEFTDFVATAKTSSDGTFNLTIEVPFNTVFAGYQTLHVQVQPSQPWQAGTEENIAVFVLNSVSLSLTLAASFSVVFVMYFRFARARGKKELQPGVSTASSVAVKETAAATVIPSVPTTKFEGLRGRVLKAYVDALSAVQTSTGATMLANMTLREYLRAANAKLGKAAEAFSELTELAERSIYSPYEPKEEAAAKAESLADTTRRNLTDAAA